MQCYLPGSTSFEDMGAGEAWTLKRPGEAPDESTAFSLF